VDDLVPRVVDLLDEQQPRGPLAALELLAHELARALDAAAWSISCTTEDGSGLRTVRGIESVLDAPSGVRLVDAAADETYPLSDFPATARALADRDAFIAGRHVPGSDPAELAVLSELGYDAVLVVAAADRSRAYLLELYADRGTAPLDSVLSHARVLADYCMRH
jgi:hypothetical protein